MTAVSNLGKGLFAAGEFNNTLLCGDINAFFSAPAASQQQVVIATNDLLVIGWSVLMTASGAVAIDIWRTSITESGGVFTAPTIPTNSNSITGTYTPTIASGSVAHGGSVPGYPSNASSLFELGWGGNGVAAKAGLQLFAGDFIIFNVDSYTAGGAVYILLNCLQGS
jgi:hypothetical protein